MLTQTSYFPEFATPPTRNEKFRQIRILVPIRIPRVIRYNRYTRIDIGRDEHAFGPGRNGLENSAGVGGFAESDIGLNAFSVAFTLTSNEA